MRCPYCESENRDDREKCYHCAKDLTLLRLLSNRAKNHYNKALEHAERGRPNEAIAEAGSALELDSRLTDARLLLGTLYARQGRTEEAREQWQQVLRDDPTAKRAHDYLGEVGSLERAVPLLRRVRGVIAAAILLGVGSAGVAAAVAWPSREEAALRSAWAHFAAHDLAKAEGELSRLERPLANATREESARALEQTLHRTAEERLALVSDAIATGAYADALRRIEDFSRWHPTQGAQASLGQFRAQVRKSLASRARAAISERMTLADFARVEETAAMLAGLFPDATEPGELRADARRQLQRRLESSLADADAKLAKGADSAGVRASLESARGLAEALGQASAVVARLDKLARAEAARLLADARDAWSREDGERALEALARLDAFAAAPEDAHADGGALRAQIERARAAKRIDMLRRLLDERRDAEAVALAATLAVDAASGDQRRELEGALASARRRLALADYYSLMRDAARFESGSITESQARAAVAAATRALDGLPASLKPAAIDDLLYFRGVSHRTLGESASAEEDIARLAREYPASPYLLEWRRATAK